MVATGMSYKQIAERLVLSHRTVQNHVQNTLRKLQMNNRVQLTRWAIEHGLDDDADDGDDLDAYLARLGLTDRPPATVDALRSCTAPTSRGSPTTTSRSCSAAPTPRRRGVRRRAASGRPARLLLPPEHRPRVAADRARLLGQPASRARLDPPRRPARHRPQPPRPGRVAGCRPTTTPAATGGSTPAWARPSPSRCRWCAATTSSTAGRFGIGAGYGAQAAGRPTGPGRLDLPHLPAGCSRGIVVTSRDHSARGHRRRPTAA